MKLSFDWLSDFVDLSGLSAQEVADKLTMGAFEVEEVSTTGPDIEGPLLVGQIMEINPHPNADKIRLTKIKFSEDGPAQEIVCGAWNIEVGHRIPVALPGAKVINRHDGSALFIKENKIRGVSSNGMLCSAPELGLSGSGEGILILDPETKLGADAKELLGLKADYVLHVEPRSNRGDALSVLGLAREVAALFGRPLKKQNWNLPEEDASLPLFESAIEDAADCPFFTLRTLGGFKVGPSDPFISARLESVGLKPINNIVDITNYILYELGQPLHAYDVSRLKGNKLTARLAREGEAIETLDQKERKLNTAALVIADNESVVGVAGVMGGKDSEVSERTETIALEAACFTSARVRRSSRLLGLSSDASLRFERGVDSMQVEGASNRAAYLLVKHCGARLGRMSKAGSSEVPESKIQLRMSELKRICDIDMNAQEAGKMLEPLGFKTQGHDASANAISVFVPSFRLKDVYREVDLIEEVTRLYGYNRLPVSMPASTIAAKVRDPIPAKIRLSLCASGLSEAWLSSLTKREELMSRATNGTADDTAVEVQNPLSAEHQVLRQSLVPGLIKAASYNQDYGNLNPCLFELGKVYRKDSRRLNSKQPANRQTGTHEELMVSGILCSEPRLSLWNKQKEDENQGQSYYLVKGVFENLLVTLGIDRSAVRFEKTDDIPGFFHPGRSASCVLELAGDGKKKGKQVRLGFIGELHPAVCDSHRLSGRAAAMEVSVQALTDAVSFAAFKDIYSTPSVQRDLTADLPHCVKNQELESVIRDCTKEMLTKLDLVSVFKLSDKQKSLSYRLTFQDPEKTLTAETVDSAMSKVRDELAKRVDAKFRL